MANNKINNETKIETVNVNNRLAEKLKAKSDERFAEFKNPYIEDKTFKSFPDFNTEYLENRVELSCVTKLRKHVKDDNDNNVVDENGEYVWEYLYAFIDKRFPDVWSFGGSALKSIYNDLVDDTTSEDEINKALDENPIVFRLHKKKLESGKNKGKIMTEWLL